MPLQICETHRDQIRAALAVRDLNRFNIKSGQEREAHMIEMDKLGEMRVDPFRVAQELILKRGIQARGDLVFKAGNHCPCCVARSDFERSKEHGSWPDDVPPWDIELIDDAVRMIDNEVKAKGLK